MSLSTLEGIIVEIEASPLDICLLRTRRFIAPDICSPVTWTKKYLPSTSVVEDDGLTDTSYGDTGEVHIGGPRHNQLYLP